MAAIVYIDVENDDLEELGHGEIEPVIERKMNVNEILAEEMKREGIRCESLPVGSHPLEGRPSSSHMFMLTSRLTTNRGLIRVIGRNVDFVQVIQRN